MKERIVFAIKRVFSVTICLALLLSSGVSVTTCAAFEDSAQDTNIYNLGTLITDCASVTSIANPGMQDPFVSVISKTEAATQGLELKSEFAWFSMRQNSQIIARATFPEIDISEYASNGSLCFWLYIGNASDARITGGEVRCEISSAGIEDQNELQWNIKNYCMLQTGWNLITLPLYNPQYRTGAIDLSHVNFVRIYTQTAGNSSLVFAIDEFRALHRYELPSNIGTDTIITPAGLLIADGSSDINNPYVDVINRVVAAESGIALKSNLAWIATQKSRQFITNMTFPEQDLSAYAEDGYVHFWFFVENVSDARIIDNEVRLELSSSGTYDNQELQWNIKNYCALQNGWNEISLPISEATRTSSAINLACVNFIRMYTQKAGSDSSLTFLIDEIRMMHENELPNNINTDTRIYPLGTLLADGSTANNNPYVDVINRATATQREIVLLSNLAWLAAQKSTLFITEVNFTPVDLSGYADDGYVHFWFYVEDALDARITDNEVRFELSSSGTYDNQELQWNIKNYCTLQNGWNEISLPLSGATRTESAIDLSCTNYIRMYTKKAGNNASLMFMIDEISVLHESELPINIDTDTTVFPHGVLLANGAPADNPYVEIINRAEAASLGLELKSNTAWMCKGVNSQIVACSIFCPSDISSYAEDGYMYMNLYIDDVSNERIANGELRFELSSAGTCDVQELQWNVKDFTILQNGWNTVILPFGSASESKDSNGNYINYSTVNYIRLYTTKSGNAKKPLFIIDEIRVLHEAQLPDNIVEDPRDATERAASVINSSITGALTVRIDSRKNNATHIETAIQSKILEMLSDTTNIYGVEVTVQYATDSSAEILFSLEGETTSIIIAVNPIVYEMSPRIIMPEYDNSELIIAEIVIGDEEYPVDATGTEDSTSSIQTALNDCAMSGGGTVWLPAGKYRVTDSIIIPAFVTLRGDYQDPDTQDPEYGTIILADVQTIQEGNNSPLFRIGGSAGAVGLTIYYPNQNIINVLEYPFALYTEGRGDGKVNQMLPTIKNCTLINAYQGIGICDGIDGETKNSNTHEQAMLINIKGTFLKNMLTQRNGSDVGAAVGLSADSKYWTNAGAGLAQANEDLIKNYTRANGTAIMLGDLEAFTYSDVKVKDYNIGIRTYVKPGSRSAFYGEFYKICVTDTNIALLIENVFSEDSISIAASTFCGTDYSIRKITDDGVVKLTDVELVGTIAGNGIVLADNDAVDLSEAWADYFAKPVKVTSSLRVPANLDNTGTNDMFLVIQQSLNSLAATGGVVYLPAGHYRLDSPLQIPAGVELRGSTYSTQIRPEREGDGGTILEIRHGYNTTSNDSNYFNQSAIILGGNNAGISGLVLAYRDQEMCELAPVPKQTAYAIYGNDVDNTYIVNVAIAGATHGIYLDSCDDHLICGLATCCFQNVVAVVDSTGGSIQRVLQNATVIVRNAWTWSDWSEKTSLILNYTSENLDCFKFANTEETIFAYYDYRGHNTYLSEDSNITVINSGSGGDSTGYIVTADGGSFTGVNLTCSRIARKPLQYGVGTNVHLYGISTRGNLAMRAFDTPDWTTTQSAIWVFEDCDGEIPAKFVAGVTDLSHEGKAWRLSGNQVLLSEYMTEVNLTPYTSGAIHFWLYSESGISANSLTFLLGSNADASDKYVSWSINNLHAGWNEIWLHLSNRTQQIGTIDLSAVNFIKLVSDGSEELIIDEIGIAPTAACPT